MATIEEIVKQTIEYANSHYGLKCGEDFPAIASQLETCEAFMDFAQGSNAAMVLMCIMQRPPQNRSEAGAIKWLRELPGTLSLLEAFYMGMKYGQQSAELKILEQLTEDTNKEK